MLIFCMAARRLVRLDSSRNFGIRRAHVGEICSQAVGEEGQDQRVQACTADLRTRIDMVFRLVSLLVSGCRSPGTYLSAARPESQEKLSCAFAAIPVIRVNPAPFNLAPPSIPGSSSFYCTESPICRDDIQSIRLLTALTSIWAGFRAERAGDGGGKPSPKATTMEGCDAGAWHAIDFKRSECMSALAVHLWPKVWNEGQGRHLHGCLQQGIVEFSPTAD